MIANAEQALKRLRHKRTGEILPTKTIDRNTKLVYLTDDCIGLRFHNTIIARYERDGVRIDTRDSMRPKGWFTVTTWNRIDAHTPATTCMRDGLRYVMVDPSAGWSSLRLYAHGTFVSSNGSCKVPLEQAQSDAIADIARNYKARAKRIAERCVKDWRDPANALRPCCQSIHNNESRESAIAHIFEHHTAGERAFPAWITDMASARRGHRLAPDELARAIASELELEVRDWLPLLAIARIAPDFPYPQR